MRPPPAWPEFARTLDAFEDARDPEALDRAAGPLLDRLGATLLGVASSGDEPQAGPLRFGPGLYPSGWLEAHAELRRPVRDPLARLMLERERPFDCVEILALEEAQGGRAAYRSLFARFGLTEGLCVPRRSRPGRRAIGLLAGPRPALGDTAVRIAARIFIEAYADRQDRMANDARPARALLTRRQIACLVVAASGRSSIEIAAELRLAPKTVDAYLAAAADRLGVTNRTAAVSAALRLGLIS